MCIINRCDYFYYNCEPLLPLLGAGSLVTESGALVPDSGFLVPIQRCLVTGAVFLVADPVVVTDFVPLVTDSGVVTDSGFLVTDSALWLPIQATGYSVWLPIWPRANINCL